MKTSVRGSSAFVIHFRDLGRWDPTSYHTLEWGWPTEVMKPVKTFLRRKVIKALSPGQATGDYTAITIHLDGSIEPRRSGLPDDFRMQMFEATSGDVVVSKIDLKHGAVGVLPAYLGRAVVTSHFAVYEPDKTLVEPDYFHLLIQSSPVKELLWRNKVGGEGRKEVKLEFFEDMLVPVPPLSVQRKILKLRYSSDQQLRGAEVRLQKLVEEVETALQDETRYLKQASRARSFVAHYSTFAQWDLKAGRASAFFAANPSFLRFGDYLEECTDTVDPASAPEHQWPVYGVSNRRGVFLSMQQPGSDFNSKYKRIQQGWFFHNPTRANVGSLGMVPEVPADALTSPEYQVWRVSGEMDPDYVALLLQTKYFLDLVQFNRVGAVKQRMYFSNLAEIRLPRIDLLRQKLWGERRKACLEEIRAAQKHKSETDSALDLVLSGRCSIDDVALSPSRAMLGGEDVR